MERGEYLSRILKKSKQASEVFERQEMRVVFQWVFALIPLPGKPAGIRYSIRDCLHALQEKVSGLADVMRAGTSAFQNVNIPSSEDETKLESDLKGRGPSVERIFS